MSSSELACVYSALILHDDDVAITGDKIQSLISAAGLEVEPFWPGMFAKALEGRNIGDLLCNV
ncbi:60S acidic ribosomal protein P1, partial [Salmonella sp. s51933]